MTMGEMEMPVVLAWKRPDRVRVETTIQGLTRIQAFDGEVAWGYMPFAGQVAPERMPAEAVGQMQNMADFDGPLVNWQEKGHRLEMVGPDDAAGEPAWKLKLTRQGGEESFLWLDAETFLEVRQAATRSMGPDEIEVETVVGDYREVDGLLLPHAMEIRPVGGPPGAPSQTVTIESYDLGAEIPDSEFAFPAEPEGDEGG
jgi:outer membrane lipoprotein-sorting protein